jgi:hypothetical protein
VTRSHWLVRTARQFGSRVFSRRRYGWQDEVEPDARQVRPALLVVPLPIPVLSAPQHGCPMPPQDWQVPAVTWLEQTVFGAVQTL